MADQFAWHVHHDMLYEELRRGDGGMRGRQDFIRTGKSALERPLRLKLLKLIKDQDAIRKIDLARQAGKPFAAALKALHEKECPDCPFRPKNRVKGDLFALGYGLSKAKK